MYVVKYFEKQYFKYFILPKFGAVVLHARRVPVIFGTVSTSSGKCVQRNHFFNGLLTRSLFFSILFVYKYRETISARHSTYTPRAAAVTYARLRHDAHNNTLIIIYFRVWLQSTAIGMYWFFFPCTFYRVVLELLQSLRISKYRIFGLDGTLVVEFFSFEIMIILLVMIRKRKSKCFEIAPKALNFTHR